MSFSNNSSTIFVLIILATTSNITSQISAADINITNNCPYTVWAAAVPGGGHQLLQGQNWMLIFDPNFHHIGKIWGRTNCDFTRTTAKKCDSGDCNGALLCDTYGQPPQTLAEYSFGTGIDFLDISLVDGFNVPIAFFIPEGVNCSWKGNGPSCSGDMINEICPTELRDVGGCLHPCTVFESDQFCCSKGPSSCDSKEAYFKFFKDACPEAYSYPYDDSTSTFSCPSAKIYNVVFCPTYG